MFLSLLKMSEGCFGYCFRRLERERVDDCLSWWDDEGWARAGLRRMFDDWLSWFRRR